MDSNKTEMERLEEGLLDGGRDGEDGPEGGDTREEGLNQEDHHRKEGLANGTTSASEQEIWKPEDFKKRECNTFIEDASRDGQCQCGRPRDKHPTDIKTAEDTEWTTELHSSERPTDAYGGLEFEGEEYSREFLRLSSDTEPYGVYDLMTRSFRDDRGWSMEPPSLVVSVVGGEGSAEVKPWVQEVIREGLVKALHETGGGWILTEGFDGGVGRCVGEAVKGTRVYAGGISPWGLVHNRDLLVDHEGYYGQYSVENKTSDSCCLEKNHWVFLLVDDGSEGRGGGEKNFRVKFEEHIPTQHIKESSSIPIPVLCMLISGESSMLERVDLSLKSATPWLVLAGSGGVADLLSDILENQSPSGDDLSTDRVTELVKKHFPSEAQTDQLVEQVQTICQNIYQNKELRELITFYHEEKDRPDSPEGFDTVMIKALMPASKQPASGDTFPYSKELFLAMRCNRVDFASSQLFNDDITDDDIKWKDEALMDCMTFALNNDKTQFVRLFIEKKFILTYGLLEKLYSRVNKDTLLYKLLLEHLKERLGTSDLDSLKEISLLEVSGVLKKFMGEEKPFYSTALGLKDFTSGKKALEDAKELLKGECSYRNNPCEFLLFHLFIWAVLQNHSDWADFFWEKAEEPVLNALSACKMLKEMSTLETETDTKLSMEKLAQKFGNRAHGVLDSCYQSNESNSFELLNRKSPVWDTNCFQMGIAVGSHSFFKHDGLESTLSQAWCGDMEKDTAVWKVLLTLFCLPLCFTNLISYREPDESQKLANGLSEKPKPSFVVSRWRQFWSAPVTSFVGNALMYFPFLFLFAYVLLADFKPAPPSGPSISEYVLYFWVFTFLCQEIYEAFFMRDMTLRQRMKLYMKDVWTMYDCTAILLFIVGLISRMFEGSGYEFGRCVLCIDYMVFTLRLIHIFAVDKQMGPKIIIVGKMVKDIFSFILLLGVWIVAYGVANQGLKYHYDPDPYRIFLQVFYIPYLHIFGEEIDVGLDWDKTNSCTSNVTEIESGAEPCRNEYWLSYWLVIILLVVFLLVTVILLLNLLIAMLTNTFQNVEDENDHHWKFQHYNLIVEYQARPVLAPPFIIINHLYLFFSFLWKKIHSKPSSTTASHRKDSSTQHYWDELLKAARELRGSEEQKELLELFRAGPLKDWETELTQKFLTAQSDTEKGSDSERIKQISDKVANMWKQQTEDRKDRVSRMLDQQTQTIDQKIQQMTDRMEKQQQKQLQQLEQRQRDLETKVENALGQILDLLKKRKH